MNLLYTGPPNVLRNPKKNLEHDFYGPNKFLNIFWKKIWIFDLRNFWNLPFWSVENLQTSSLWCPRKKLRGLAY